jgi:hypothetical protein
MTTPDILALDFDGVMCDGMAEYFETSRRTWARIWPGEPEPGDELLPAFRRLRPVIMTGWEMPLLLREWIAADRADWVAHNTPYFELGELRRLVGEPERSVLVTTKEGEFARLILDDWRVSLADIQGKEAGTHKCDNLRALIDAYAKARGRRPGVWFVEDRLETLEHVTIHPDLEDVGLYLAAWGYNTPETRAAARAGGRVRLLELAQFTEGLAAWP